MGEKLARLLGAVPRESAPEIPLERILDRAAAARRRALALTAGGALAFAGLVVGLRGQETPAAPVHLRIHVVEYEAPGTPRESPDATPPPQPEEFDRP